MGQTTSRIRGTSIGAKLSFSASLLSGGLFLIFILIIGYSSSRLAKEQAIREIGDKTKLLATAVDIVDRDLRVQVNTFLKVLKSNFKDDFSVDSDRTVDVAGKKVSVLKNGETDINLNFSIPDRFTNLTGVFATVFVRSGEEFIRVTTSHKKENGERAIGTTLDHAHPGYQLMLEGKTFAGAATLFGGQYMTQYDPIKDAQGKVIGILYVGVNFTESMKSFANGIKTMKIGDTGVFYAINAKPGKDYGKVLIHPSEESANWLDKKDSTGFEFIKAMLEQKQGNFHYLEQSAKNGATRERVAAFAYIKNWNMVIVGDGYLDEVTAGAREQRNWYALFGCLILVLIAGSLYFLIRALVSRPLGEALKIVETVAAGNLTSRIDIRSNDEIGRLMTAMKHMNDNLSKIVGEVHRGADTIATTSNQIATGNENLQSRTEQQASSLEETASAMEELTSTVKHNGDNARQANQLAVSASEVALKGGVVVSHVTETMDSINNSSKKIADIIGVIDGIAFQTNILALNAAVEAARAGEQGRGFAVVASEVRNLAQRSASASKEIKVLINDSVEKVDAGSKLVKDAGETMEEIVASIKRVTDIMGEIAVATGEQETGIGQINQAINEMDNVTQQNAALVEEAAAASILLRENAFKLVQTVSVFKLDEVPGAANAPAPAVRKDRMVTSKMPHPSKPRLASMVLDNKARSKPNENTRLGTKDEWDEF